MTTEGIKEIFWDDFLLQTYVEEHSKSYVYIFLRRKLKTLYLYKEGQQICKCVRLKKSRQTSSLLSTHSVDTVGLR